MFFYIIRKFSELYVLYGKGKSKNMNNIDLMNFWIESSDEDYNVVKVLHKNKKTVIVYFLVI